MKCHVTRNVNTNVKKSRLPGSHEEEFGLIGPVLAESPRTSPTVWAEATPELEDVMGQADQQPLSSYLFQTSQEKGSDTSGLFDLAEDGRVPHSLCDS
jgi:hypothetical protein